VSNNILIRADASPEIGTGHVMRCLSLAIALREQGKDVIFIMAQVVPSLQERIEKTGSTIRMITSDDDASEALQIAKELDAAWIIIDGYPFDAEYQKKMTEGPSRVLYIDDYGQCDFYIADLILNQNIAASEGLYRNRSPETQLLLGPAYALLRPEFQGQNMQKDIPKIAKNILVTLGGSDADNISGKVLTALSAIKDLTLHITVILGGANPNQEEVKALAESLQHTTEVVIDVRDIAKRMQQADLAIAAGGTTTYELLSLGVPFITGAFAENQKAIADALEAKNLAQNIGWYPQVSTEKLCDTIHELIFSEDERKRMSKEGKKLVNGNGASRTAQALLHSEQ